MSDIHFLGIYLTLKTGPEGNSEFCFPRISMFTETKSRERCDSREKKFTVPQGTSH